MNQRYSWYAIQNTFHQRPSFTMRVSLLYLLQDYTQFSILQTFSILHTRFCVYNSLVQVHVYLHLSAARLTVTTIANGLVLPFEKTLKCCETRVTIQSQHILEKDLLVKKYKKQLC